MIQTNRTNSARMLAGRLFAYAAVLAGMVFSASAVAQSTQGNLLQSINTSTLQGGKVIIRANFKDPLAALTTPRVWIPTPWLLPSRACR